jgi:cell wall-associated NlpC family hydrolase
MGTHRAVRRRDTSIVGHPPATPRAALVALTAVVGAGAAATGMPAPATPAAATGADMDTHEAARVLDSTRPAGATDPAAGLHHGDAEQIAELSGPVRLASATVPARRGASDALDTPSTVGAGALSEAMTRLGDPYEWGGRGPHAFDCSGLVQWAFKQMGVRVPRSSTAQSQAGRAVSRDNLKPGDLVFFYSPISHVGIYMGHNKIVHASEPGKPVKISKMTYPYHSARRVS